MTIKTLINYVRHSNKLYTDIITKAIYSDNLIVKKEGKDYYIKDKNKNEFVKLYFETENPNEGLTAMIK